jgi:hypothetical protein
MPLQRRREPFDHPDWLFELKWDGFRTLAQVKGGGSKLVSRNAFLDAVVTDARKSFVRSAGPSHSRAHVSISAMKAARRCES